SCRTLVWRFGTEAAVLLSGTPKRPNSAACSLSTGAAGSDVGATADMDCSPMNQSFMVATRSPTVSGNAGLAASNAGIEAVSRSTQSIVTPAGFWQTPCCASQVNSPWKSTPREPCSASELYWPIALTSVTLG